MTEHTSLAVARGLLLTEPDILYTGYVYGMILRRYSADEADEALDRLGYRITTDAMLCLLPPHAPQASVTLCPHQSLPPNGTYRHDWE